MRLFTESMDRSGTSWAIFGGVAARCYGADCPIRDVDVITSASLDFVAATLPGTSAYSYQNYHARLLGEIEIWASPLLFDVGSTRFTFAFDAEMRRRVRVTLVPVLHRAVPVLAPEDLLVMKALQQRDAGSGKHDVQDLRQLCAAQMPTLDYGYLRWRARRVRGVERIAQALAQAGMTAGELLMPSSDDPSGG